MKKLIALILALILVFTAVACSSNEATSPAPAPAESETQTGEETAKGEENYKIVFSMTDMNSAAAAYWSNLHVKLGAENGLDITLINPGGDAQTQSQQIMDAIAQGIYDVLVVYPNDPEGIIPCLKAAKEAGMIVEVFGCDINEEHWEYRDFMVACDDYLSGQVAGEALIKAFPDGCNVVEVGLQSGIDAQIKRHNGFVDAIEGSNINLIATQNVSKISTNEAMNVMQDLIVKYGDEIDAVYCQWDDGLAGCILAEESAGMDPVSIWQVAVDGNKTGFQNVLANKQNLSIMQNFDKMVAKSIELLKTKLSGGEVEGRNILDWDLVTPDTINDYEMPAW